MGARSGLPVLLAAVLALTACGGGADLEDEAVTNGSSAHELEVLDWRERRIARLTEPYGYLSLVGLFMLEPGEATVGAGEGMDIVVPRGPERWGVLRFDGEQASFEVDPSARGQVTIDGAATEAAVLLAGDEPSLVEADDVQAHLVAPGGRVALRVRDPQSPARTGFAGIESFPIDSNYRVEGRWVAHEAGRTITTANVLGQLVKEVNPGRVEFELDGTRHSLEAIDSGDDLFYILADRTSGRETYGLGRFLYSELPDENGMVVLDFNKLYNPPCAFTEFSTCSLPPEGNRLDAWLRVGERAYGGAGGRPGSPAER